MMVVVLRRFCRKVAVGSGREAMGINHKHREAVDTKHPAGPQVP